MQQLAQRGFSIAGILPLRGLRLCDCIALRMHPLSPPRRANGANGTRGVAGWSLVYNGVGVSWMELELVCGGHGWMEPGLSWSWCRLDGVGVGVWWAPVRLGSVAPLVLWALVPWGADQHGDPALTVVASGLFW